MVRFGDNVSILKCVLIRLANDGVSANQPV